MTHLKTQICQELRFYEARNWDWNINIGRKMWYGTGVLKLGEMPNKERVTLGYWRVMAISGILFVVIAIALINGVEVNWK